MHNQVRTEPKSKPMYKVVNCLFCDKCDCGVCFAAGKEVKIIDGDLYCDSYRVEPRTTASGTVPIMSEKTDNVNHPAHYETGKFECFDVMIETQGKEAVLNFCICNAFKYIYRFRNKGGDEDIKKANWYLSKYLELRESE